MYQVHHSHGIVSVVSCVDVLLKTNANTNVQTHTLPEFIMFTSVDRRAKDHRTPYSV